MSQLIQTHYEKLLAGCAAVAVAASVAWVGTRQSELTALRPGATAELRGDYAAAAIGRANR